MYSTVVLAESVAVRIEKFSLLSDRKYPVTEITPTYLTAVTSLCNFFSGEVINACMPGSCMKKWKLIFFHEH